MVPGSSPRVSKGVLALAWRLLSHFFARGPAPGVAPEASEECFDSFEVLVPFVMARPVWLFPHANWSLPGCLVRSQVLGLVC
jgi:hypothetical protein